MNLRSEGNLMNLGIEPGIWWIWEDEKQMYYMWERNFQW